MVLYTKRKTIIVQRYRDSFAAMTPAQRAELQKDLHGVIHSRADGTVNLLNHRSGCAGCHRRFSDFGYHFAVRKAYAKCKSTQFNVLVGKGNWGLAIEYAEWKESQESGRRLKCRSPEAGSIGSRQQRTRF
ncbi:hypothetical protein BC834DRAFT_847028 [Gloeopeniophorella convolvens]|nr:hypothetical protein BC834DRAFT_847028 [Gloeopeniophorella convolvens]